MKPPRPTPPLFGPKNRRDEFTDDCLKWVHDQTGLEATPDLIDLRYWLRQAAEAFAANDRANWERQSAIEHADAIARAAEGLRGLLMDLLTDAALPRGAPAAPWRDGGEPRPPRQRAARCPPGTLDPLAPAAAISSDYDFRPVTHYITEIERLISRAHWGSRRLAKDYQDAETARDLRGVDKSPGERSPAPGFALAVLVARDLRIAFAMIYNGSLAKGQPLGDLFGRRFASARDGFIKAAAWTIAGRQDENLIKSNQQNYGRWIADNMGIPNVAAGEIAFMASRRDEADVYATVSALVDLNLKNRFSTPKPDA